VNALLVIRCALLSGARDHAAIFTWRTWLGGWFLRVLAQVSFFALLGRVLHSHERMWFLLVGNAVMLAAPQGIYALNMVSWERNYGTLPLLAASPTNPVLVLASRGLYLVADGTISGLGALFVLGPLLGMPMPWARLAIVVPLTVLVGASAYCFGTFLGGILIGFESVNSLAVNLGYVLVMTLGGVNVPLNAYPRPVTWASDILPLTHGLVAIRHTLNGQYGAAVLPALTEALVGAGWLAACVLTFGMFIRRGRGRGSLDYAG
jgi:ABC-2 type transport system permease protein